MVEQSTLDWSIFIDHHSTIHYTPTFNHQSHAPSINHQFLVELSPSCLSLPFFQPFIKPCSTIHHVAFQSTIPYHASSSHPLCHVMLPHRQPFLVMLPPWIHYAMLFFLIIFPVLPLLCAFSSWPLCHVTYLLHQHIFNNLPVMHLLRQLLTSMTSSLVSPSCSYFVDH